MKSKRCLRGLLFLVIVFAGVTELCAWPFSLSGKSRIRVLAIGDSVMWGQGLSDRNKFCSMVCEMISCSSGLPVEKTLLAHSGAIIGRNESGSGRFHGEVPSSYPTILQQCAAFNDSPETVDLVLVDGGANDLGLPTLADPGTSPDTIRAQTRQYCYDDMLLLLRRITAKFPNAKVVVTGYYQALSDSIEWPALAAMAIAMNFVNDPIDAAKIVVEGRGNIIENNKVFQNSSRLALTEAVEAINRESGPVPRVLYADHQPSGANGAFGSASWVFGLQFDFTFEADIDWWEVVLCPFPFCLVDDFVFNVFNISPVDEVIAERRGACDANFIPINPDRYKCHIASVLHPNQRGARAYASAIAGALGYSWADFSRTMGGDDRMEFPFHTLSRAVEHVPTGGTILVKSSGTPETIHISKACRIEACGGPVVIGKTDR